MRAPVTGSSSGSTWEVPYRDLIESLRDYAIFMLGPDGTVRSWNLGAETIKGYTAAEIIGRHFSVFYPPEALAQGHPEEELRIARLEGRYEEEGWRLRKDGSRFWASVVITAVCGSAGELVGFSKVTRDLTERRASEQALRESEERFRLLVQSVKDYAIIMLDPQGNIVSWNEGATRIKGWNADEIVGRHFENFYPEEDVRAGKTTMELEVATREGSFEDHGWRMRKDGSRFWANVIITALRDARGQLRGFSKVTRDITARRQAEEKLRRAYDELETFSYSVSHDLRAPLRSLDGFSQVLASKYAASLDAQGLGYLERIRSSAQRMGQLIDDLLNLSRLGRLQLDLKEVDLSELAAGVLAELQRNEPGRQVELVVAPALRAFGDRSLLRIALENLLRNAWKYTSRTEHARIEFASRLERGRTVFYVRDNGAGFDMAYVDKLFGAFQRLHGASEFPGTGIGLATVKRIVQRHGGEVCAAGEVGRGATFSFTLGFPESP